MVLVGGMCSLLSCRMELVFAIMHLYIKYHIVSYHSFFIFFFNLVLINYTEWSTIPACPSLMCSFNRGNIEHLCLVIVYVCFMFVN